MHPYYASALHQAILTNRFQMIHVNPRRPEIWRGTAFHPHLGVIRADNHSVRTTLLHQHSHCSSFMQAAEHHNALHGRAWSL